MSEIVECITFIVQKTCWSLGKFLQFVLYRILDLIGLLFNALACVTLYRLPYMLMSCNDCDFWRWRTIGIVHFLIFLSDIPFILAGIIVMLTIWRVYPMVKELKEEECRFDFQKPTGEYYYSGCKPRYIIMKHFCLIFIDIIFVPAGLLCLISWRCKIFISAMRSASTDWDRRKTCFLQLFHLFVDMPCILLFLMSCITWRLPFVIHDVRRASKKHDWDNYRFLSFKHFFLVLLDIPCLICLIFCSLTWRCPFMWRRLLKRNIYKEQFKMRQITVEEFGLFFCDIPCILCAFFVLITLFRIRYLVFKVKKAKKNGKLRQWKVRIACLRETGMVWIDVFCFLMSIIVLATLWRAYPLVRDVKKRIKKWKEGPKLADDKEEGTNNEGDAAGTQTEYGSFMVTVPGSNAEGMSDETTGHKEQVEESNVKPELDDQQREGTPVPEEVGEKECREDQNETVLTSVSFEEKENVKEDGEHGITAMSNDDEENANTTGKLKEEGESVDTAEMTATRDTSQAVEEEGKGFTSTNVGESDHKEGSQAGVGEEGDTDSVDQGRTRRTSNTQYSSIPEEENIPEIQETPIPEIYKPKTDLKSDEFPGWKIRKDICKHFIFLFVDIPAIAFVFLLLVTYIKFPKLLSRLVQSEDFYLEFAITVYHLTLQLLIDLVFLILFLFLVCLRPIDVWVHLLEDEEHKKYRLLCHFRQWVPDILAKRRKCFEQMDELLSVDLKMFKTETQYLEDVVSIFEPYFQEVQWLAKKVKENDLDPDFAHILDVFMFYEKRRPEKLKRRYECESWYIQRPDPLLRKENLFKLHREMLVYEGKVGEQEKSLQEFEAIKVPLWASRSGLRSRSRKETQRVLIKCLPRGNLFTILLTIICWIPIYRGPGLTRRLWRRWYDRSNIVLSTLREYGKDILALGNILLVFIFVYRAPFLVLDLTVDIVQKRSWKAARKTAFSYPPLILEDFLAMIDVLTSWKTPRFIFTAFLFGLLMPADLFLNVAKLLTNMKLLSYLMSILLYILFVGFPFLHVFYLGPKFVDQGEGWLNIPVLGTFLFVYLLVLFLMVMSSIRKNRSHYHLKPDIADYVHFNWFNMHVIIFEVLEFLQLAALIFSLRQIPMYGGSSLNEASKYLLMSFVPFTAKFWITFILFWIWFMLSGAPVIFEEILEDLPKSTCAKHSGWRLALSLFANTLFVTLFESLTSTFGCTYPSCQIHANITCTSALIEDVSYNCWTGSHSLVALFGLLALVWYGSTALIFGSQYGDTGVAKLDVTFSPLYDVIVNLVKGIIVVATVVITENNYVLLGIVLASIAIIIVFTFVFEPIFKFPVCNLPSFVVWRIAGFFTCALTTIVVLVAYGANNHDSKAPLIILVVGICIILISALIASIRLRRSSEIIVARTEFIELLQALEERLMKGGYMLKSWTTRCARWKRMVSTVREARKDDYEYDEATWSTMAAAENKAVVADIEGQPTSSNAGKQSVEVEEELPLPPPPSYNAAASQGDDVVPASPLPGVECHVVRLGSNDVVTPPFGSPIVAMKHTGVNVLLVFEQSIQYLTFNYAFMSQRETWLAAVAGSNWTGLLHCLKVLEGSLGSGYVSPTRLDLALGHKPLESDTLAPDAKDLDEPPAYTPEPRDLETIAQLSKSLREKALDDIAGIEVHGEMWSQLMNKVLPTLPVIRSWNFENVNGQVTFSLRLRRAVSGTITAVGPNGIKLARGANIVLGKQVEGMLWSHHLTFTGDHKPKGKKGPVQVTVKEITLVKKKNAWYLDSEGKKLKFDKAIDTIGEVEWK